MKTIGDRIEMIRTTERRSVEEFIELLSVSKTAYYAWKHNKTNPSSDIIVKIMDLFKSYRVEWLVLGEGNMKKSDFEVASEPNNSYGNFVTKMQLQGILKRMIEELDQL